MQPDKETVLKAVKENRWNIQSFNGRPIFLSAAARSGWYVGKALGSGYRHFFYLLSKTRISMYYDEEDWRRIGEAYYASVSDVNGLSALIERYEREYREHTPAAREPLRDLSPAALIAWVQAVAAQLDYSVGFAHGIEGITFVSEARLRTLLEKRGVMSEMLLSKLSSPTHVSFLSRVRRELWDIHGAPANEKLALAKRFLASYAWIENT